MTTATAPKPPTCACGFPMAQMPTERVAWACAHCDRVCPEPKCQRCRAVRKVRR